MKPEVWKAMIQKYRYALGVLLLGVLLLVIPGKRSDAAPEEKHSGLSGIQSTQADEDKLRTFLEQLDGVGKTRVLLSYAASEEHTYVKDSGETVLVSAGSGREEPLEKRILYPVYQGAVVLCEGADDAKTQLRVTDAVRQYTGLRTDQISVLPIAGGSK